VGEFQQLEQIVARQDFFWYVSPSHGRFGGILVGVKNPEYEGVLEVDEGEFFVRCMMENKENSFKWNLITIYGAAQLSRKERICTPV
jgi:hypothetical protein